MKRALFVLLMAVAPLANSASLMEMENDLTLLPWDIEKAERDRTKALARESELRVLLQKLPNSSPNAERFKAELAEEQEIVKVLAARERGDRDRERQLRALIRTCPERKIMDAIDSDRRKPSKTDVSGVWRSRPGLPGYVIQLEQRGKSISGEGCQGSCFGNELSSLSGSYEGGKLSLTFSGPAGKFVRRYRYCEERYRPRFKLINSQFEEWIMPVERKPKGQ